jgi:hypothetical protein
VIPGGQGAKYSFEMPATSSLLYYFSCLVLKIEVRELTGSNLRRAAI